MDVREVVTRDPQTDHASMMAASIAALAVADEVVRAAGGVVIREARRGALEVLLIHRPAYDDWSLPKGKAKTGERLETAALREVEEETGLICLIERALGTIFYVDRRGRDKVVWYWLMRPVAGEFAASDEVDEERWLPVETALATLSYDHDGDLLRRIEPGD